MLFILVEPALRFPFRRHGDDFGLSIQHAREFSRRLQCLFFILREVKTFYGSCKREICTQGCECCNRENPKRKFHISTPP